MFALRDESGELVTNENLRKKIKGKVNLKYDIISTVWDSLAHCMH